jgi:glycosyltransferase 2 family protein
MSRPKKIAVAVVKLAILAIVVWAVRRTLVEAVAGLDDVWWRIQAGWLVAAALCYLAGLLAWGLFWHRVLVTLGQRPTRFRSLTAYFVGHLGKYVPGKALVVILRAGLIRGPGVDTTVAAVSVFVETFVMIASGALLAALVLAATLEADPRWTLLALGIGVLAALPILPPVFRRIVGVLGRRSRQPAGAAATRNQQLGRFDGRLVASGYLMAAAGWIPVGASLWAVLRSLGIENAPLATTLPWAVAVVALAVVAGFLSLLPGGLGVRDVILLELMVPRLRDVFYVDHAESIALAAVLLLRLVFLGAEVAVSAVLYAAFWKRRANEVA